MGGHRLDSERDRVTAAPPVPRRLRRALRRPRPRGRAGAVGALAAGLVAVVGFVPEPATASRADSIAVYTQQLHDQEAQLQKLRQEIQSLRQQDASLAQEEVGTLEQLKLLDREVALTEELLRKLSMKQERIEAQLEGIRVEHEVARERLKLRKERLARTLRAMYVHGAASPVEVLLRTTSLRGALTRFKYLGLLARNNERLLTEIREQEANLAIAEAQLTEMLSEISSTSVEARNEKRNLEDSRKLRRRTLEKVRAQRGEFQKSLQTLAQTEKQVQALVVMLEKRRQEALAAGTGQEFADLGFDKLRGRMPWPVRGKVITRFGRQRHPRYGTVTMNSGIDIRAPAGEPVRCVARGRVEYVSWLDGYGRTVIVNHGSGHYTVYAHLDVVDVDEGQVVVPGQQLGTVGETGSLDGPKLHFEIRTGDHASSVDPMSWLTS